MKKKIVLMATSLVLVAALAVGGTLAWLTAQTDPIVNTFTVGNVGLTLTETQREYKMVPGNLIEKDPKVTVEAGSEACWVFVKIEESANLDDFITYTVADEWTQLPDVTGVYYREYSASATDNGVYPVLKNNQVTVNSDVTKKMMDDIQAGTASAPTLTFTAYAVQKENVTTAADAWAKIPTSSGGTATPTPTPDTETPAA